MCSVNAVSAHNICDYLPWSTDNAQNCTEGRIERSTLFAVSFMPLGVGQFYSGDYFNGIFELAENVIAITSLLVWYYCKRQNVKLLSDILLTTALVSCCAIEIIHMICSKQVEVLYIITMFISLTLTCTLRCCCCNNLTVIVTISTMCFLIASDTFMVWYFKEVDGYGCPLID